MKILLYNDLIIILRNTFKTFNTIYQYDIPFIIMIKWLAKMLKAV